MTQNKYRDRVMAEITLSHLLRLASEHGYSVSREQALAFLNQRGRAYEMWKHMMQAGEDFIAYSFLRQSIKNRALRTNTLLGRVFGWFLRHSRGR
jgi:hypothetical protein